jgi:hypothetical protein
VRVSAAARIAHCRAPDDCAPGGSARVLLNGLAEVALAQRNDLRQTLRFDGTNKPFCICVQIGAPRGKSHRLHTGRLPAWSNQVRGTTRDSVGRSFRTLRDAMRQYRASLGRLHTTAFESAEATRTIGSSTLLADSRPANRPTGMLGFSNCWRTAVADRDTELC